jgi:hypothetical protein
VTTKNPANNRKASKIQKWILVPTVLGVGLLLLSMVPYSAAIAYLSRLESDGSFDSLAVGEYSILSVAFRIIGILCLVCAGVVYTQRNKILPHILTTDQHSGWVGIRELVNSNFSWQQDSPFLLGLAAVIVCGIAIRLLLLQKPVGYDEAYTFIKFASRDLRYIVTDYSGPNNHIFHSLCVALIYRVFGNSLWALRLPAFLAGILCIPAGYLVGRKLFHPLAGLIGATGIALMPVLIDYSNNARGYTLVCLFALTGLWLATELLEKQRKGIWALFSITSILGFYTIPTYLYPFAVLNLWLFLAFLIQKPSRKEFLQFISRWIGWGVLSGIVVLALYAPVLIFGTGLQSIVGNEFVQSLSWHDFRKTLFNRIPIVWGDWWFEIPPWYMWVSSIGFVGSFFAGMLPESDGRTRSSRLHVLFPAIVSIGLVLTIQRVVPLTRVWMFLLTIYLVYCGVGFAWLVIFITKRVKIPGLVRWFIPTLVVCLTVFGWIIRAQTPKYSEVEAGFDYSAAKYLSENLAPDDQIFAVAPASMRVAYYMKQMDIPLNRFYDRDLPNGGKQGYILVIEKSKYGTPESILDFLRLTRQAPGLPIELVFKEKRMELYRLGGE